MDKTRQLTSLDLATKSILVSFPALSDDRVHLQLRITSALQITAFTKTIELQLYL